MQGRERVRILYQSEVPNPTQPTLGRKKKIKLKETEKKSRSCQQESIDSALETRQSHTSNTGSLRWFQRDTERGTKVLRY